MASPDSSQACRCDGGMTPLDLEKVLKVCGQLRPQLMFKDRKSIMNRNAFYKVIVVRNVSGFDPMAHEGGP